MLLLYPCWVTSPSFLRPWPVWHSSSSSSSSRKSWSSAKQFQLHQNWEWSWVELSHKMN
uniref:Uncharacterized protein n=1 Tax=Oryza meridionalis TaxID=40149 RepID=A0A0E0EGA3_9ORYZ